MERITHSMDSALTALYIMTSEAMPKEVFIEDVIDRITNLAKFQLQNSIYPEFDPVYRVSGDKSKFQARFIFSAKANAKQILTSQPCFRPECFAGG